MITTIADLNSLYNLIYEDALFVARETNLMVSLVRNFSATGYMDRKLTARPQLTAQDKPEGVDYQNAELFGKSLKATLTPKTIMAQTTLTDEDIATDPDSARTDAAQELGGAIGTKIDKDLLALLPSLTTGKGAAGSALTIGSCGAAVSVLRTRLSPRPIYIVIHPYGWQDIWLELGQPAAQKAFLGELANRALKDYYVGNFISVDWFTSANIEIDSSDDAVGAAFNPQSLGFDSRQEPVMEPDRDPSRKVTELNMSAGYAVGILRQEWAVKLTHDATEPV